MVLGVTVEELHRRMTAEPESLYLLDVREPEERAEAAILPSAHIPMDEVPNRTAELPKDKDIVVYCHSGARSMMIAGYLEGEGFTRVGNLSGGIDAWSRKIDPKVPRYL